MADLGWITMPAMRAAMTVYVDNMEASFGRMTMCHMWADTRDELFAMADRIGVARKWFQRPPEWGCAPGMDASWEHFDIAKSKRALAVQAGAVETTMRTMAEHANRQKFLKACNRGDMTAAQSALHMMMLCHG